MPLGKCGFNLNTTNGHALENDYHNTITKNILIIFNTKAVIASKTSTRPLWLNHELKHLGEENLLASFVALTAQLGYRQGETLHAHTNYMHTTTKQLLQIRYLTIPFTH